MTIIHAKIIGDEAVMPRSELDRLIEIARRSEEIDLQIDDLPAAGIMYLAQIGGAFDEFAEPEALEDSVWAVRAREASEKGMMSNEETREFFDRMLDDES